MFKYVTVICVVAALCAADQPPSNANEVQILRFDSNVQADGYNFDFETSDGTSRQEEGKLDGPPESEDATLNVKGQYSFVAPDGKKFSVTFTAGPNGYEPHVTISK